MSETPSPYDLIQDQRIGPMEDVLSQAAEPPTGDEFSYPIVGQGWSTSMWRWMTRGIGNGILYAGGHPYMIGSIDNNAQTAQILVSSTEGTANAIMDGFFHELRANKTVALPMPSSTTTYTIALTFDPRRERDAEGPISIEVYSSAPPTTFGRKHIVLWEVTRRANELLSDARMVEGRQGVSPVINANSASVLPDPDTVLSGTIAVTSPLSAPEIHFARHYSNPDRNEWVSLSDPEWDEITLNTYYAAQDNHTPMILRRGTQRTLQGMVRRPDGQNLTTSWSTGWFITTLPSRDRPSRIWKFPMTGNGQSPTRLGGIEIYPDGGVYAYSGGPSIRWVSLDNISWWV